MTKNNMELWDSVCKTDPSHTKKVNQRGGFTAIDAMYQMQEATRAFGPVGIGWGWDFDLSYPPNDTVVAKITMWHGKRENTFSQVGQKKLGGDRVDEDAVKKAVTDGLTKCLSYLGFNADVFLGKFDDNKYVEEMKIQSDPAAKAFFEWAKTATIELGNIVNAEELDVWLKKNKATVDGALENNATKASAMSILKQYSSVKAEHTDTSKTAETPAKPELDDGIPF
tara:strand:- start:1170 stop:1844 length:675 start_codon:yes stop_codon:yes gene_type:complete